MFYVHLRVIYRVFVSFLVVTFTLGPFYVETTVAQQNPISAQQFGVYGTRWAEWVSDNHHLAGFYIYQIPRKTKQIDSQRLREITATGINVIGMQTIYPSVTERFMRVGMKPDLDAQDVVAQIEAIFSDSAFDEIRVISIDEENFWWNGRAEYLTDIYKSLTVRLQGREIWQWFNDNQRQYASVEERFKVPADGYIADMYSVDISEYETRLLGYVKQGKPVVSILWASPNWKHGERADGRQADWWDEEGWRIFYIKTLVNRQYGVRTALFMYDLPYGNAGRALTPNFKSDDPCARAFTRKLFDTTLPKLGTMPIDSVIPKNRPDWMAERCPAN